MPLPTPALTSACSVMAALEGAGPRCSCRTLTLQGLAGSTNLEDSPSIVAVAGAI
jgi:hypothetical protein